MSEHTENILERENEILKSNNKLMHVRNSLVEGLLETSNEWVKNLTEEIEKRDLVIARLELRTKHMSELWDDCIRDLRLATVALDEANVQIDKSDKEKERLYKLYLTAQAQADRFEHALNVTNQGLENLLTQKNGL